MSNFSLSKKGYKTQDPVAGIYLRRGEEDSHLINMRVSSRVLHPARLRARIMAGPTGAIRLSESHGKYGTEKSESRELRETRGR